MNKCFSILLTIGIVVSLYAWGLWASASPQDNAQGVAGSFDEVMVQFAEREKLNVFCDASDMPPSKARPVNVEGKRWEDALHTLTKDNDYIWWSMSHYSSPRRPGEALLVKRKPSADEILQIGLEVNRELSTQPVNPQLQRQAEVILNEGLTGLLMQLPEERQRQGVLVGELPNAESIMGALWYSLWMQHQSTSLTRTLTAGLPPDIKLRSAITEQQPFLYIQSSKFRVGFNTKWAKEESQ